MTEDIRFKAQRVMNIVSNIVWYISELPKENFLNCHHKKAFEVINMLISMIYYYMKFMYYNTTFYHKHTQL